MKIYFFLIALAFIVGCVKNKEHPEFNGSFESTNSLKIFPKDWSSKALSEQTLVLDQVVKYGGKYSLSMKNYRFYNLPQIIENSFFIDEITNSKESTIELRGFIKTEEVNQGYAGIWLRLGGIMDGQNLLIESRLEFRVQLPYSKNIKKITFGSILKGIGHAWIDNFKIYLDGKPVERLRSIPPKNAQFDTSLSRGSGINKMYI